MSGFTAALTVQQAIYSVLSADATLTALTAIYDFVPDGAGFPYVSIGEATEVPDDTHEHPGHQVTCTLHVWSRASGFTEALTILQSLHRLLDDVQFPLAVGTVVWSRSEFVQTLRDPDGITRHVPVRYRVWTQNP